MSEESAGRQPSQLEALPAELLNEIYRYAVVEDDFVEAATCVQELKHNSKWRTNEPALARTCTKFRREVLPIYYAENIFEFPDECTWAGKDCNSAQLEQWLEIIGPVRKHITRVGATSSAHKKIDSQGIVSISRDFTVVASKSRETKQVTFKVHPEAKKYFGHCCSTLSLTNPAKYIDSGDFWPSMALRHLYYHFNALWDRDWDNPYCCECARDGYT